MINLVKVRLSNIELLRILSMLGVLIVHADFGALGEPTRTELLSTPPPIRLFGPPWRLSQSSPSMFLC